MRVVLVEGAHGDRAHVDLAPVVVHEDALAGFGDVQEAGVLGNVGEVHSAVGSPVAVP
jgi:hypothetical protein